MRNNRFLQPAPENFLSPSQIASVHGGRRGFMAGAFSAAAVAAVATAAGMGASKARAADDTNIVNLPGHTKSLGQGVAARGYGVPSVYEKNLQRRESPGLTRVSQAGVSFAPLQGLFGIITPSGLTLSGTTKAGGTLSQTNTG